MGRLYWKFFIFFFLAQLTAVTVVALWMANQNQARLNAQVETSPPARSLVDATAVTLQYGGVEGMRALLQRWSQQPMPQVYAVNEQQTELFNRHLPNDVIQNARAIFERQQAENAMLDRAYAPKEPVQKIKANDQHEYLLFVPVKHLRVPQNMPQRSIFGFHINPRDKHLFPLMPLLAGALASFIFAAILAWYFSKPITTLRQAFASAANGNLDVRVSASMGSRRDELADLGKAFDGMATRLGVLLQSQTRLLHQVSHELRSPLARLQIAVGLARQQPDKLASSLNRIERESERMDDLVGELLALSRLESGVINLEKESINLNELLLTVVEDARFEGDAKQISIDYEPLDHASISSTESAQVTLLGQQDLLHRAIDNVVRNALKFSASQSHITIKTSVENKIITITVTDQGLGVDKAELDMIFQAFFRGSNTNQTDGHGVGLAMARQIIEAHGGAIVANNQPTGGLCVTITLPKVE